MADSTGYVAIGMSQGGQMVGSDAVLGAVDSSGVASASWYALNGKSTSDVVATTSYGLTVSGGSSVNGRTMIKLVLDDANAPATFQPAGSTNFLWAIGTSDSPAMHSSRGSFRLNLVSGDSAALAVPFSVWQWQLIHGLLMFLSWGVLLPLGVFVARFLKADLSSGAPQQWYVLHRTLQLAGLTLAVVGLIICLTREEFGALDTTHGSLGIVVMVLGLLQPLNAVLRPHKPADKSEAKSTRRVGWEYLHKGSGYGALVLAAVTILMGIDRLNLVADLTGTASGILWYVAYAIVLGALAISGGVYYMRSPPSSVEA